MKMLELVPSALIGAVASARSMTPMAAQHHETVREALREAGINVPAGLRVVEGKSA